MGGVGSGKGPRKKHNKKRPSQKEHEANQKRKREQEEQQEQESLRNKARMVAFLTGQPAFNAQNTGREPGNCDRDGASDINVEDDDSVHGNQGPGGGGADPGDDDYGGGGGGGDNENNNGDRQNQEAKDESWKTVNLQSVPIVFHDHVRKALKEVHDYSHSQSKNWNQHTLNLFSNKRFPWKRFEKEWQHPNLKQGPPSFVDFLVDYFCRIRVFLPDRTMCHLLPDGMICCKFHPGSNECLNRDKLFNPQGPRIVLDVDGSVIYEFSSRYYCKIKKMTFAGHSKEVLTQLSPNIRVVHGAVLTAYRGFTVKLVNDIIDKAAEGLSFTAQRKLLVSKQIHAFNLSRRSFQALRARETRNGQRRIDGGVILENSSLKLDDVIPYPFPCRQTIQDVFVHRVRDLLPFYERMMQLVGGRVLRGDRSYKVVKFIYSAASAECKSRGQGSYRSFDSVYTVMNEHGQIAAIFPCRDGSYDEVEQILTDLRQRYTMYGYEEVSLFYTDNCCHEYNMLTKALPSLAHGDKLTPDQHESLKSATLPVLPLPDSFSGKTIRSYGELRDFCLALLTEIDNENGDTVLIGLDTEHDSFTLEDRQQQKPETLQLSNVSGSCLAVIQLSSTFKNVIQHESYNENNMLRRVLTHEKVVLCGNMVKGDINKLYKHYPIELFGGDLTQKKKLFDPNVVGRNCHVIPPGRGNGRLSTLMEKFLGARAGDDMARSTWSSKHLTKAQIEYAARDALASAKVSAAIAPLCQIYRRPRLDELVEGAPVRLLAAHTNTIVAYGKICSVTKGRVTYFGMPRRRNKYDDVQVYVLKVVIPAAHCIPECPDAAAAPGAQLRTLGSLDLSQTIYWSFKRMQLSTEKEIVERTLEVQATAPVATTAAAASHPTTHAATTAAAGTPTAPAASSTGGRNTSRGAVSGEDAAAAAAAAAAEMEFPDDTTLRDYPVAHIHDGDVDDERDFVIISDNESESSASESPAGNEGEADTQEHPSHEPQQASFSRNGVKLDAFHAMQSYKKTLKKKHGIYLTFKGLLRDAIFMVDPDLMEQEREKLAEHLYSNKDSEFFKKRTAADNEARRRLYCPSSKVLDDVPRMIPVPGILERRIQHVVNLCANVEDAKTGEKFFSQETWKVHKNTIEHVRRGCLSDRPGHEYYYTTTLPSGKTIIWCTRGTSQLEGFHSHLRRLFPGFHMAPLLATCLLAVFVYRWNVDRAVERGLLAEEYAGCYNHETVLELQELSRIIAEKDENYDIEYADFPNHNDRASTGEEFFTPHTTGEEYPDDDHITDEPDILESTMLLESTQLTALHDKNYMLPLTPVLCCEESAILGMINSCRSGARQGGVDGNRNQHGSFDYNRATEKWNNDCYQELTKPLESRRKMFPKNAQMLRRFHKQQQERENQRRTHRQTALVEDSATGVARTVLVDREVKDTRQRFQEESQGRVPAPQAGFPPLAHQNAAPSLNGTNQAEPVAVPPLETQQGRDNLVVMDTVTKKRHLIMPSANSRPLKKARSRPHRCMRCGLSKSGPHHQGGVGATTAEYCTVPVSERQQFWKVMPGYEVNDNRTKIGKRGAKARWDLIKQQAPIEVVDRFELCQE